MSHSKNSSRDRVFSMEADESPSDEFVGTLPDDFGQTAIDIFLREDAPEDLITRTRESIIQYREAFSINPLPSWYQKCKAKPDIIFTCMLDYARMLGPEGPDPKNRSQRYVSSAMLACRKGPSGSRDTFHAIVALAMNWFVHFLWICGSPFFILMELYSPSVLLKSHQKSWTKRNEMDGYPAMSPLQIPYHGKQSTRGLVRWRKR